LPSVASQAAAKIAEKPRRIKVTRTTAEPPLQIELTGADKKKWLEIQQKKLAQDPAKLHWEKLQAQEELIERMKAKPAQKAAKKTIGQIAEARYKEAFIADDFAKQLAKQAAKKERLKQRRLAKQLNQN
jgi:hypothetical protein